MRSRYWKSPKLVLGSIAFPDSGLELRQSRPCNEPLDPGSEKHCAGTPAEGVGCGVVGS
jgi:hypothetical protein